MPNVAMTPDQAAEGLVAAGRRFYARGWVLGTSGNFSVVSCRDPLRLAITASSVDKGALDRSHILDIDETCAVHGGVGNPSAETLLHFEIVRRRGAGAVLHTHSVWSTLLSDSHGLDGGLMIEGYEMLKGLDGVRSHEHREWVPIVSNDQDMTRLAPVVGNTLDGSPAAHAILLQRHGLYTWGASLAQAVRHVEILEFLFETIGRTAMYRSRGGGGGVHHGIAQDS
jgi:methylthioribulose-1-phosphate dehydratase